MIGAYPCGFLCLASWPQLLMNPHQVFVPGRSGELRDVLIDLAGFAAGMSLIHGVQRLFGDQLPMDPKPVDDSIRVV